MENNPAISIIIPIYNAEKYIEKCMESVCAQTFTDYELILVNDGSTDKSADICKRYRDNDSRITYIEKENGGAGSARNAGMKAAKGRYLAFPDADDSFLPEMYSELFALADSGDFDMVFSGVNYYRQAENSEPVYSRTDNIKAVSYHSQKECREHIMDFFPTTTIFDVPWNKLYKRSIVVENDLRFPDIRRCQDATFNIDFFNCINSAAAIDKAYYNYMENTVEDVQRKFPKDYINIVTYYYPHLIKLLTDWGVYDSEIKQHYDTTFVLSVYSAADRYDNPLWKLSKEEQRGYITEVISREEIVTFLDGASVRADAQNILHILKAQDADEIMRIHRREKRKETLKQNKLIVGIYRKIKN